MRIISSQGVWRQFITVLFLPSMVVVLLTASPQTHAAAPARGKVYAEPICNTDPNVFFCEDFNDSATAPTTTNEGGDCSGKWLNPGFVRSSYCWNSGGSLSAPTLSVPGVPSSGNQVYRMNIGAATIDGFLKSGSQGKSYTDYYIRWQFYYSNDVQWPVDLDIKQMLTHPEIFLDPPSANYQNGIYIHEDFFCSGLGNFGDVIAIRYGPAYNGFPVYNEYCPPLSPGQPANGSNAVRLQRNRWYTVEVHFRLGTSSSTGLIEAWLDDNLMYRANRATCTGSCPPMSYVYFTSYKNLGEPSFSGYVEYDNIVMSTSRIGVPSGTPPPSVSIPGSPTNLSIK